MIERVAGAVWRDCRDAWRSLRGAPGFTAAALVLLAFAIGLNTAVFTVINAVLFRPLAVRAPHELAFVSRTDPRGNEWNLGAYEDVQRFAANADLFTGGAGVELDMANARIEGEVEALTGERVSANYFDVLGVAPRLGRTLVPALDAAPGAERVVVLSEALWRRHFNADPAVIGKQIALGTTLRMSATAPRYTIVGVIGPEFTGVSNPWAPTEYWVEFTRREDDHFGLITNRTPKIGMVVARMRPGVTLERARTFAEAFLTTVADLVVRPDPAKSGPRGPDVSSSPRAKLPFGGGTIAPRRLGAGLMLVAGLVLAIGAANLAGLMMTRGVARRRDVAIRLTLGATWPQIARQLVTETLLLAVAGGLVGLALSRVFVTTLLDDMALGFGGTYSRLASLGVPVDRRVILFTTLVCVITGLAVGLAGVRRTRTTSALSVTASESLGAPTAAGRSRRRHWILVPQLALSLALLLVALMAVRGLLKVALVPTGYEPHRVAYVTSFAYRPWVHRLVPDPVLVGRGRGSNSQLLASLQDLTKRADANIGVLQTRMVSQVIDEQRYPRRLAATLFGFCALGALALAASGPYGVLSYAVAQRRRELGIRAALGARRRDLVLLVVREGAAVAGIGSIVGVPLALVAMQIASHYVLPIPAIDVLTLGIAPVALGVLALAACCLPARRAARVDPIDVLRAL